MSIVASNIKKLTSTLALIARYVWGGAGTEDALESNFEKIDAALSSEINTSSALEGRVTNLEQFVNDNTVFSPQIRSSHGVANILPDSGRFSLAHITTALSFSSVFDSGRFFNSYNGTIIEEAGKFIYNNTTNGGTGGVLTSAVITLLAAMATAGRRYGAEFYVARLIMGSGTALELSGKYLLFTNTGMPIMGCDKYATFSAWVKTENFDFLLSRNTELLINGEIQASDYLLTSAAGWVHMETRITSTTGYDSSFPYIYGSNSGQLLVAMPVVMPGRHQIGLYTSPIQTINHI